MRQIWELYGQWLRRELALRFAGSVLGPLWLVLQPLLYIAVSTLVFHRFFNMRWPSGDGSALDYGLKVFVGLSLYTFVADVLQRSAFAIVAHPYLVTKVRFPLPLLPCVTVGVAAVQMAISLVLMLPFALARGARWELLLLPILLLPLLALALGAGWMLAALGAYLRDIGSFMPTLASFLLFLTPVFYPAALVPQDLFWVMQANPLAWVLELVRGLLLHAQPPATLQWQIWGAHLLATTMLALVGWWFFRRVRPGFADVL